MDKYSIEQRTQVVKLFYENKRSIVLTQRAYQRHFDVKDCPTHNTIRNIVRRFEEHGSVLDLPRTGRPRNVITNENRERVRESIEQNPETSIRQRSTQLGISRSSLHNILHSLKQTPDPATIEEKHHEQNKEVKSQSTDSAICDE